MSEYEGAGKYRVITIHGANSRGRWQEETERALGVFFDFKAIKHNHYRWLFGTELVFCPFVWLPLGILFAVALKKNWIKGNWQVAICVVALLLLAHLGVYPYRTWAVNSFKEKLSNLCNNLCAPPCLIAHSLGTYLAGRALLEMGFVQFDRIVLAGCVLRKDYPWGDLANQDTQRFVAVRNEMATKDWVVRLAARLKRFIPGFGTSGYEGFTGPPNLVHNLPAANIVCLGCQKRPPTHVVHNVKCQALGHGDVFLGPGYAVYFWLPFLFGYDPAGYQRFLGLCHQIDKATRKALTPQMKDAYGKLRLSSWGQLPRKTLDQAIVDALAVHNHVPTEEELDKIASETLRFVLSAQRALDDESTTDREKWVQFLDIGLAIDAAWKQAFPAWKTQHGS